MKSLAIKYRPQKLSDVVGQVVTIETLQNILNKKMFNTAYLFSGHTGTGKTTIARCFASEINGSLCGVEEIDAASNNSVDNVRDIISSAYQRSLNSEYKIYIIDEAHSITSQGWQAFLKTIEEPPAYTIFIFCTTEPRKIPGTVLNRLQRFDFKPLDAELIKNRLELICEQENFTNFKDGCTLISYCANGSLREAITYLEQVSNISTDITPDNVNKILPANSYKIKINLTKALISKDVSKFLEAIDNLILNVSDIKDFVSSYLSFLIKIYKCCTVGYISEKDFPVYYIKDIKALFSCFGGKAQFIKWQKLAFECLLKINDLIRFDPSGAETLKIYLYNLFMEWSD